MSLFLSRSRLVRAKAPRLIPTVSRMPPVVRAIQGRRFNDSSPANMAHAVETPIVNGSNMPPIGPIGKVSGQISTIQAAAAKAQESSGFVVPHGQLDIRDQANKPEFYEAVSKIMSIRKTYHTERVAWVPSAEMIPILRGLGATVEDIACIPDVGERLWGDPTLPFRKSRNSRFCIDYDTKSVRRLEFQPFALSVEEDFKRYDSGQLRRFDEVENDLQLNTAFQALMIFKAMILHRIEVAPRPKLNYSWNKFVCTLFCLRTVTTSQILGEPALEGVHSDGVDHTMTTFIGSNNMADHSAATFMHSMEETTGISLRQSNPELIRMRVQHRNILDTLLIVDHEYKHSLSAVRPADPSFDATRDMLIFFTRKPVERDHISGSIDSLTPHEHLPMEIPLFIPNKS